jgi:hypothetical protein
MGSASRARHAVIRDRDIGRAYHARAAWGDRTNIGNSLMFASSAHAGPITPEPGTLLLLGSSLIGLVGYGRTRRLLKK